MTTLIHFNGKTYLNVDEMPPDIRQVYEQVNGLFADKNQNGIPDMLEGNRSDAGMKYTLADDNQNGVPDIFENAQDSNVIQTTTFVVDGKTYQNPDDMPAEARQRYQAAMAKIDADQDDIPDWLRSTNLAAPEPKKPAEEVPAWLGGLADKPTSSPLPTSPVIEPEGTDIRLVMMGCVVFVLIIVAAGLVLFQWIR